MPVSSNTHVSVAKLGLLLFAFLVDIGLTIFTALRAISHSSFDAARPFIFLLPTLLLASAYLFRGIKSLNFTLQSDSPETESITIVNLQTSPTYTVAMLFNGLLLLLFTFASALVAVNLK